MNKLVTIWCFVLAFNGLAQQKNKMEYFNPDIYKDWEIDNRYSQREDKKFLKKQHERLSIWFVHDKIQVERTSIVYPYTKTAIYFRKNNVLYATEIDFYQFSIGIQKLYDETGKIIEEIDNDKPYIFSLPQLIEKIKKEHDVDLEDLTQGCSVHRKVDQNLKKPIYEVYLTLNKGDDSQTHEYILINGTTGEILFQTCYYPEWCGFGPISLSPYSEYLLLIGKDPYED